MSFKCFLCLLFNVFSFSISSSLSVSFDFGESSIYFSGKVVGSFLVCSFLPCLSSFISSSRDIFSFDISFNLSSNSAIFPLLSSYIFSLLLASYSNSSLLCSNIRLIRFNYCFISWKFLYCSFLPCLSSFISSSRDIFFCCYISFMSNF